jgi:hypothetical protein
MGLSTSLVNPSQKARARPTFWDASTRSSTFVVTIVSVAGRLPGCHLQTGEGNILTADAEGLAEGCEE